MSFAGDLHTFDLFDLLGWLMSRKKAGVLQMTRRSTKKRLAFRDGAVQWTSSNDPRETIGQALVRDGLITEEALFRALLKQETDKRRLGELLISDGHLSEPQLMKTLRTNAEAHLHDLFLWATAASSSTTSGRRRRTRRTSPSRSSPSSRRAVTAGSSGPSSASASPRTRSRSASPRTRCRSPTPPSGRSSTSPPGARRSPGSASRRAGRSTRRRSSSRACATRGSSPLGQAETGAPEADPVGIITTLLAGAEMRLKEGRFDAALEAYEKVLTLDGVNQAAKKGLLAVAEARRRAKAARKIPLDKVPVLRLTAMALSQQHFDPQEGFVLSRINGQWDVRSLLKLVPMPEDEVLLIFSRLLERQVIDLK